MSQGILEVITHCFLNPNLSAMNQAYLLHRAKQRDPRAIAILLNYSLHRRKVKVVDAVFQNSCLELKLQARQVPNHYQLIPFIQDELKSLGIELIKQLRISALTFNSRCPAWEKWVSLEEDQDLSQYITKCATHPVKMVYSSRINHPAHFSQRIKPQKPFSRTKSNFSPLKTLFLGSLCVGCLGGIALGIYYGYQKLFMSQEKTALSIVIQELTNFSGSYLL